MQLQQLPGGARALVAPRDQCLGAGAGAAPAPCSPSLPVLAATQSLVASSPVEEAASSVTFVLREQSHKISTSVERGLAAAVVVSECPPARLSFSSCSVGVFLVIPHQPRSNPLDAPAHSECTSGGSGWARSTSCTLGSCSGLGW